MHVTARYRLHSVLVIFSALSAFSAVQFSVHAAEPTYWQDVRPVLRKHCTVCHSAKNLNEVDVSGGLALDSYQAVLKGSTRTVIKPGKSDESKLLKLVMSTDPDKRMPLGAMPLAAENIDLLRRWIDAGAKEGQAPASVEVATTSASPVRVRKLDITL